MGVCDLCFDIDRLVTVKRVHDGRQDEAGRVGLGKAAVAVWRPLHWGADTVTVAQIDVVAHADFIAVVEDGRPGHGEEERIHQLDAAAVAFHKRREPAADAQVDAGAPVSGIGIPKIVPLLVGNHFERQLVVIAKEDRPLAVFRDFRCLPHYIGDREAILLGNCHVHARHQREVECHVAFVAIAEILAGILRPLVGLGEQHLARMSGIECRADLLQDVVGLGQVLVDGAFPLDQIGDGVEAKAVNPGFEPEPHDLKEFIQHCWIVEVEVRLVGIEAVPVIGAGDRVPGPVGLLRVEEDDPCLGELLVSVRPHVEIALRRSGRCMPGPLEPGMLVRRVVDDEFDDDPDAALVSRIDESPEVIHRSVVGAYVTVIGDVVTIVAARRGEERQKPDRSRTKRGNVVQLLVQTLEVANPVAIGVEEGLDVKLVDYRILVPQRVSNNLSLRLQGIHS